MQRRGFLTLAASLGAGVLLSACGFNRGSTTPNAKGSQGEARTEADFIMDERAIGVSNIVVPGMGLDQMALSVAQARKDAEKHLADRVRSAVLRPKALPGGFRVITHDYYSNGKFDHRLYSVVNDAPVVDEKPVPGYMWVTGYGVDPQGKLRYAVSAAMPKSQAMNDIVDGLDNWNRVLLSSQDGADKDHVCFTLDNHGVESITSKPYWPKPQPSPAPDVASTPAELKDLQSRQAQLLAPMYFNAPPELPQ